VPSIASVINMTTLVSAGRHWVVILDDIFNSTVFQPDLLAL
jgi:hypothetical protein